MIVVDNGQYGTIRMHQESECPGRIIATQLRNPDFALYARAFGGHGERIELTEEFAPAFERARFRQTGHPALPARSSCHLGWAGFRFRQGLSYDRTQSHIVIIGVGPYRMANVDVPIMP